MLNLALIPKQQEFESPSSLTHKITSHPQTTFYSSQTCTQKNRDTKRVFFHYHFIKYTLDCPLVNTAWALMDISAGHRNEQQINGDDTQTDERLHGKSSSSLVLHWSCKWTRKSWSVMRSCVTNLWQTIHFILFTHLNHAAMNQVWWPKVMLAVGVSHAQSQTWAKWDRPCAAWGRKTFTHKWRFKAVLTK